jgi:hypothetical protein
MMFPIMPWCRIDRDYLVGDVTIIPYRGRLDGVDDVVQQHLARVLGTYRTIEGRPVEHAAVVCYADRPFGSDLTPEEIDRTYEWVQLACFASLAGREFLTPEAQCNSDVFILYMQRLKGPEFVTIRTRRRDGYAWDLRPLKAIVFSVPTHVSPVRRVSLDARLLDALVAFACTGSAEWGRWQHALSCFNLGNTDSDAFRYQVEWGLLCSAFEQLLSADSKAKDVAGEFTKTIVPSKPLRAGEARRRLDRWRDPDRPVRYEWLEEFYRVRGDFSHGRLTTQQQMAWSPIEHLTLAAIGFPLLVRSLLKKASVYALSDDDLATVDMFERFADQAFLEEPPDCHGSGDSWLSRMFERAKLDITHRRAEEALGGMSGRQLVD